MNLWAQICEALPVPEEFGTGCPYVRFSHVTEDGASGEDLTLEFQEAEPPAPATIQLSHSEWRLVEDRQRTVPLLTVSLEATTGEPLDATRFPGINASLAAALMQAASFQVVR